MKKQLQTIWVMAALFCLAFYVQSIDTDLEMQLNTVSNGIGKSYFLLPNEQNLAAIPQDPKNPLTAEKVALGKLLFHEPGLLLGNVKSQGKQTGSCASCHLAEKGFFANRHQGIGEGGTGFFNRQKDATYLGTDLDVQPIHTPSVVNVAYQTNSLWNGSFGATGVNIGTEAVWIAGTPVADNHLGYQGPETQAIAGLKVHRMPILGGIITELGYTALFDAAFPTVPVAVRYDREHTGLAIAAYERTVLANQAPFQNWLRGDLQAMTTNQKQGALLFFGKAGCVQCHTGPALSTMNFHALGMKDLYQHSLETFQASASSEANLGRASFTKNNVDKYKFKTPQLYNLKSVDFYGHGSSFTKVRDVVAYKNAAIPQNATVPVAALSPYFVPKQLTNTEIDKLTDFLENALYDPNLLRFKPEKVLSWLNPSLNDAASQVDMDYAEYCSVVQVQGGAGRIDIKNLDAPIREVSVYDKNFNRVFYCPGDCEKSTTVSGLTAGDYFVSTKFYSYNWQFICESFVSVKVTTGTGGTINDCSALVYNGAKEQITITGLNATNPVIQIFDANWNTIFSCWQNNCGTNSLLIPNLAVGTYHVKVDYYTANWQLICSDFKTIQVTKSGGTTGGSCPIAVAFAQDMRCGMQEGWLTATATGGTAPYSYAWGNNVTSQALWCSVGDYPLTVTDATGCSKTFPGRMDAGAGIQANLNVTGSSVICAPVGGVTPYKVRWTGQNGYFNYGPLQVTNLPPGAYQAVIYDANWCSTTSQFTVNAPKLSSVQGVDFQAFISKGRVALHWIVRSSRLANSIEVQRCVKPSSNDFETIFSLQDKGQADAIRYFSEEDKSPKSGDNYYRISLNMLDGSKIFSEWKLVHLTELLEVAIFPNPVRSQASLLFSNPVLQPMQLVISDVQGRIIVQKTISVQGKQFAFDWSGFENGIYFIRLQEAGKRPMSLKVVVEHGD